MSGGILSGWDIVAVKCLCFADIPRMGYGRVRCCRRKQKDNQLTAMLLTLTVGHCRSGGGILPCGILSGYHNEISQIDGHSSAS